MTWMRELSTTERRTLRGCFAGWALDGLDTQMFSLVIPALLATWSIGKGQAGLIGGATLVSGALGGLLAGAIADRYGRVRALQITVCWFSAFTFLSAFAQNFEQLLVLKALQGLGFGGEWTAGAVLLAETVGARHRGKAMGVVQSAWGFGWGAAVLLYMIVFAWLPSEWAWRVLFAIGALSALLVLYIRRTVPESEVWQQGQARRQQRGLFEAMRGHWKLAIYLMLLMMAFNMFSHGSQDLYHTFEEVSLHLPTGSSTAFMLVAMLNLGALVGGLFFGALSERIGRRRAIILAALLAIPVIPLWTHGGSLLLLALGAFLIQGMVQGAWGVVPTHLNELSPDEVRGTLPGFAYQTGNLLAAVTANAQLWIAQRHGGDLAFAMSLWIAVVAVLLALLAWLGPEAHGVRFGRTTPKAGG